MSDLKKQLLEKCKGIQRESIENLKFVMDDAQKSANEYGAPKDRYDSYRTQLLRKRDMFAQQLHKANEQLDILEKIDPEQQFEKAEFGALVITDRQKLFISVGLGKFELEGVEYFAISPMVPVFQAMQGKKKDEKFIFREVESTIKGII